MNITNIEGHKQTNLFFQEQVAKAIRAQKKKVEELEEFYLANLLIKYSLRENLKLLNIADKDPLTIALFKAQGKVDKQTKIALLHNVGDFSLFISGFFSDSLSRRNINLNYYKSIGTSAYESLSVLEKNETQGKLFSTLFASLANKFQLFMDILAEVSDNTMRADTDSDLFKLYDHWIKTKSPRALNLLRKANIVPINNELTPQQADGVSVEAPRLCCQTRLV